MKNGSTWQVWDLHVHAPGTAKADRYGETTVNELCDEIEKLGIAVVGITDYYRCDLAFRVKEELMRRNSDVKVFPNIEFRDSKTPAKSRLNFHVLIDGEVEFSDLNFVLSRIDANVTHGTRDISSLSDGELKSATVRIEDVHESFQKHLPGRFIILVASNDDGYRPKGDKWSGMDDAESRQVIRLSDAIFGNQRTKEFWDADNKYKVGPKPVFRGSDAHSLERLRSFHKEGAVTWVKAEPTFPGLRELLIEPADRIRIQKLNPNMLPASHRIDAVQFESTAEGAEKFSQTLFLNPGLNSIIGARSSGKSILGAAVAHAVRPQDVKNSKARLLPATLKQKEIDRRIGPAPGWSWNEFENEVSVKIRWADGRESTSQSPDGFVTYLPQGYLNSIAEDPSEIEKLLESGLESQADGQFIEKKRLLLEDRARSVEMLKASGKALADCFERQGALQDELLKLGDDESIDAEIKELEKKKRLLTGENLPPDFEDRLNELTRLRTVLSRWPQLREGEIKGRSAVPIVSRPQFDSEVEECLGPELDREWQAKFGEFADLASNLIHQFWDYNQVARQLSQDRAVRLEKVLSEANGGAIPNSNSAEAREVQQKLEQALKRKQSRKAKKTELEKIGVEFTGHLAEIRRTRREVLKAQVDFVNEFNNEGLEVNGVKLRAESILPPDAPDVDCVNSNKDVSEWMRVRAIIDDPVGELTPSDDSEFVKVVEKLATREIVIRANRQRMCGQLTGDIAAFVPTVLIYGEYDGDRFGSYLPSTMSAGKRAMAGLSLILGPHDDPWPIVIDQPEDDLDSRSISRAVVPFLRKTKQDRQILMISHNANLVVGADSELVIVANQHGGKFKNPNKLQDFYNSGALESSRCQNKKGYYGRGSVRSHICEILDGGEEAFAKRAERYSMDV